MRRKPTTDQRAQFIGIMVAMAKEYGMTRDELMEDIRTLWRLVARGGGHLESPDCWCGPTLEYRDEETGVCVYVHNRGH